MAKACKLREQLGRVEKELDLCEDRTHYQLTDFFEERVKEHSFPRVQGL